MGRSLARRHLPLMHIDRLLDEARTPGLREAWGTLLARSAAVDVAVTHVRLSTLRFREEELLRVQRIRVLVARVSATDVDAQARALWERPAHVESLDRLCRDLERGRIAVRAAPLAGWEPDFSVFHTAEGPRALLVGPHRFEPQTPLLGPCFVSRHGRRGAARAARRFHTLWARGHDVGAAVAGVLRRARSPDRSPGVGTPGSPEPQRVWRSARRRQRLDTPRESG